jgi:hypothetical protein
VTEQPVRAGLQQPAAQGERDRAAEEEIASRLLLTAAGDLLDLGAAVELPLLAGEAVLRAPEGAAGALLALAGGRADLVEKETAEREVLNAYAPVPLSEAEVEALIDEARAATGASGPQELGKVMGFVMGKAKGKVDGSAVQAKVRARLGG